jgi:hypothetical protein
MSEGIIDSWDDLLVRRFEEIPGSAHFRWVPFDELRVYCTPRFQREYEECNAVFAATYVAEDEAYIRRYVYVTTSRQKRSRRRRR